MSVNANVFMTIAACTAEISVINVQITNADNFFPRCGIRPDVSAIYRHRQFLLRAQASPGDRNRRLRIRNRNLHLHVLRSVSDPELRLEGLVLDYLGDNPPRDLVRHGVQAARGGETQTAPPCYIIRWHSSKYRLNGWFFIEVGR